MRHERADHTPQTTALVNEAYVRLVDVKGDWHDRSHFLAICAQNMQRILVDAARKRASAKRGDEHPQFPAFDSDRAAALCGWMTR